ncbi:hypothetical protein [Mycolicibacterium sp. 120270]|uniref:hypothetical protein n=1 Tax=Mycolicibacterium sp. 120270 TaxID=3090600 RepID=UPI00299F42BC|nr:hypothetical protein [Mycolicibacterium sp. 120270]MDX1883049.1 hypothetical protein [Mycolicibacterium sp. 120270]
MTTPDTTGPDDTTPDAPTDDATTPDQSEGGEQEAKPNSEAARYRVERNQARAERDALADKVTAYQRRDAEAVVADVLAQPADLWDIGGASVADFLDDDDNLLEDELRAAAAKLLEQRPGLAKTAAPEPRTYNWGQHGGTPTGSVGWGTVLGGR